MEEGEDTTELYKDGLREASPYLAVLELLDDDDKEFDTLIKNSDVLEVMRTEMDMRDADESRLKRVISICFDTLEEAGYGERKPSSGDYPTRFSFSGDWTLASMLDDLYLTSEASEDVEDDLPGDDEEEETRTEEREEEGEDEIIEPEGDVTNGQEEGIPANDDLDIEATSRTGNSKKVDITINIDLDMNEMDTAEFEKKLEYLKELF